MCVCVCVCLATIHVMYMREVLSIIVCMHVYVHGECIILTDWFSLLFLLSYDGFELSCSQDQLLLDQRNILMFPTRYNIK